MKPLKINFLWYNKFKYNCAPPYNKHLYYKQYVKCGMSELTN